MTLQLVKDLHSSPGLCCIPTLAVETDSKEMCEGLEVRTLGDVRALVSALPHLFYSTVFSCVDASCGRQADQEPAVCPGCQEGQWDPGVHQEECGQQVEGGSPPPLFSPSEAPSAVLCPVLGSPVQER